MESLQTVEPQRSFQRGERPVVGVVGAQIEFGIELPTETVNPVAVASCSVRDSM